VVKVARFLSIVHAATMLTSLRLLAEREGGILAIFSRF